MAASESIRFDIVGNDKGASDAFSRFGRSVADVSSKMDGATAKSIFLEDALKRQRETARRSADATLTLAKTDKVLGDAMLVLAGDSAAATRELGKVRREADRLDGKTVNVKVDVDRSGWSRIGAMFGGGGSGGGGGLGGAGGAAGSGAGGLGSLGPWGIGGIAAVAATLAPGLIGLGIGGGVGALGVGGALLAGKSLDAQVKKAQAAVKTAQAKGAPPGALPAAQANLAEARMMAAPFTALTASVGNLGETALMTFAKAVGPLLKPLPALFAQMGTQLKLLGPMMTQMFSASLPFVRAFSGLMLSAGKILMPAFTDAMQQMVKSGALPLMTQGLTILIKGLAGFITALGPGMRDSAKLFLGFAKITAAALRGTGLALSWLAVSVQDWAHRLAVHAVQASQQFDNFRHRTAVIFDGVRGDIGLRWNATWNNTVGRAQRGFHDVAGLFDSGRHNTVHIVDLLRGDLAGLWNSTWNNTVGRVARGIADVVNWFRGLPGRITGALASLPGAMLNLGKWALTQLWNGLKAAAGSVAGGGIIGWLGGFAKSIVGVFKKIWGWFSPSSVMYEGGKALMQGLANGIRDHAHLAQQHAAAAASKVASAGAVSGNVTSWINSALRITGMPQTWFPLLAKLVRAESGGNPRAANLTPAGIAAGYPEGIGQVTVGTFAASHLPGLADIWNPVDNLVAGIRHILTAWGTIFNIPGLGSAGPYGGYALGTASAAPGWAWVGEHGPELMRFHGGEQVAPAGRGGGNTYIIHNHVAPGANPAEAGRLTVAAIRAFEKRSGPGWRK